MNGTPLTDRNVQYPTRYHVTPVAGTEDIHELTPAPGEITDEGTLINKGVLYSDETKALYPDGVNNPNDALEYLVKNGAAIIREYPAALDITAGDVCDVVDGKATFSLVGSKIPHLLDMPENNTTSWFRPLTNHSGILFEFDSSGTTSSYAVKLTPYTISRNPKLILSYGDPFVYNTGKRISNITNITSSNLDVQRLDDSHIILISLNPSSGANSALNASWFIFELSGNTVALTNSGETQLGLYYSGGRVNGVYVGCFIEALKSGVFVTELDEVDSNSGSTGLAYNTESTTMFKYVVSQDYSAVTFSVQETYSGLTQNLPVLGYTNEGLVYYLNYSSKTIRKTNLKDISPTSTTVYSNSSFDSTNKYVQYGYSGLCWGENAIFCLNYNSKFIMVVSYNGTDTTTRTISGNYTLTSISNPTADVGVICHHSAAPLVITRDDVHEDTSYGGIVYGTSGRTTLTFDNRVLYSNQSSYTISSFVLLPDNTISTGDVQYGSTQAIALNSASAGGTVRLAFDGIAAAPLADGTEIISNGVAGKMIGDKLSVFPEWARSLEVKIETGSYTGTGTYGASNPCKLTFSFDPKLVFVASGASGYFSNAWICGETIGKTQYNSNMYTCNLTWDGKSIAWYSSNSASAQLNINNAVYHYIAIS